MATQICSRCEETKPVSAFDLKKDKKPAAVCRACTEDADLRRLYFKDRVQARSEGWSIIDRRVAVRLAGLVFKVGLASARNRLEMSEVDAIGILKRVRLKRAELAGTDDETWNRYVMRGGGIKVDVFLKEAQATRDKTNRAAFDRSKRTVIEALNQYARRDYMRRQEGVSVAFDDETPPIWQAISEKGSEASIGYDLEKGRYAVAIELSDADKDELGPEIQNGLCQGRYRRRYGHKEKTGADKDRIEIVTATTPHLVVASIEIEHPEEKLLAKHGGGPKEKEKNLSA